VDNRNRSVATRGQIILYLALYGKGVTANVESLLSFRGCKGWEEWNVRLMREMGRGARREVRTVALAVENRPSKEWGRMDIGASERWWGEGHT